MQEESQKKKRGRKAKVIDESTPVKEGYFGAKEELAVKQYLSKDLTEREKNKIFETILEPCFRELVNGVLQMPKFQKIVIIGSNEEQLREDAFYHLVFQIHKYDPNRIGKNGQLAKAYSYLGTVVKNYFLQIKIQNDSLIAKHGGMLDVDDLNDQIPDNRRDPKDFDDLKRNLVEQLDKTLLAKRMNKNDLIVGHTLKYMLSNWHRIEFKTKNEFIRQLCYYTQLNPPVVARSLKKFKTLVYDFLMQPVKPQKNKEDKPKVKATSTLDKIITQAFTTEDLKEGKNLVCDYLQNTKINIENKESMIEEIKSAKSLNDFHRYLSNSLLKYEGLGLN